MRVNKKGLLAAGAVAVVVTLGLAGCAGGSTENDDGAAEGATLTVWVDTERVDALKGAAEAYTEKTGVEVELVGKDNADIKDDFIQQVPTGKGPDITMGAHDWLGELSTNGVVAPIELGDSAGDYLPSRSTRRPTRAPPTCSLRGREHRRAAQRRPHPRGRHELRRHDRQGQAAGLAQPFVVEQGAEGNPYHLYPFQTAFGAPVFGTNDEGYDPTDLQLGNAGGEQFATWLGRRARTAPASSTPTSTVTSPSRPSSTAPRPSGSPARGTSAPRSTAASTSRSTPCRARRLRSPRRSPA